MVTHYIQLYRTSFQNYEQSFGKKIRPIFVTISNVEEPLAEEDLFHVSGLGTDLNILDKVRKTYLELIALQISVNHACNEGNDCEYQLIDLLCHQAT